MIIIAGLVSGALLASGAIEIYFSYYENREALVSLQREKALGVAERIDAYIKEIERQISWTTQPQLVTSGSATDQRRQEEGDRARRQPDQAGPQREPDRGRDRDGVAGHRAEEDARQPGRHRHDREDERHAGHVRGELLESDPARSQRRHHDELEAPSLGLAGEGRGEGEDGPEPGGDGE